MKALTELLVWLEERIAEREQPPVYPNDGAIIQAFRDMKKQVVQISNKYDDHGHTSNDTKVKVLRTLNFLLRRTTDLYTQLNELEQVNPTGVTTKTKEYERLYKIAELTGEIRGLTISLETLKVEFHGKDFDLLIDIVAGNAGNTVQPVQKTTKRPAARRKQKQ